MHQFFHIFFCLSIFLSALFSANVLSKPQLQLQTQTATDSGCVSCHQQQINDWEKSDHAKAMSIADKNTVLAPFAGEEVMHYQQKAKFFKNNNGFKVTVSHGKNINTYTVDYTFGHYPLQQYLVQTKQGSYQVLPFAWDSRLKQDGGQRWYHNYQNEEITPQDRLHWQQPLQNWNGMCADCHSDGFKRNYDSDINQFSSTFTNINVGCVSCHGKMDKHDELTTLGADLNKRQNQQTITKKQGAWLREIGQNTAKWQGEKRENEFMDQCFACHSLRSPLNDGIEPKEAFLDQFTPQLLQAPNYHADGQIKEEVYVYGSFLQSKMYANGVNCLDCHDTHTMKVKVQGNGLCLQCHASEVFAQKQHHQHNQDSEGAQCVNCHMPETRYMGVDDRRDHSFKIPRPDLSKQFDTPNACTTCHEGETIDWALNALITWQKTPASDRDTRTHYLALQSGHSLSLEQHLAIVADSQLDIMSRASALRLLPQSTQQLSSEQLKPYITHPQNLLRLAAANVAGLIHPGFRAELLAPLLTDKLKAIRVEAARGLVDVYIPEAYVADFNKSYQELDIAYMQSTWRGEGWLNIGALAMAKNDLQGTEQAFKKAIKVDRYYDQAYSNLAEFYRNQGKSSQVVSVLTKGVNTIPASALLNYSFGLHMVRQKDTNKALDWFAKSMVLAPNDPHYAYVYCLALDGLGQTTKALTLLKGYVSSYTQNQQLVELGLSLSQKAQDRLSFSHFMQYRNNQ